MTQPSSKTEPTQTTRASASLLDGIRLATQDLHAAISDAAVLKHGRAMKERLGIIALTPATIIAAIRAVHATHSELAQNHLTEAVELLEKTESQLAVSANTTGAASYTAIRHALANSRSAIQKISAVVASTRWMQAAPNDGDAHAKNSL